jgi:hypothetical protein
MLYQNSILICKEKIDIESKAKHSKSIILHMNLQNNTIEKWTKSIYFLKMWQILIG